MPVGVVQIRTLVSRSEIAVGSREATAMVAVNITFVLLTKFYFQ